jgi:hypothetical protein
MFPTGAKNINSQVDNIGTSIVCKQEKVEKNTPSAKSGSTAPASAIAASATADDPEAPPSIDIASACCRRSSSSCDHIYVSH